MEPIIITAILKPKEGLQEKLLVELKKVQLASSKEAGCLKYTLHQSFEDDTFILYEIWADNEAVKTHIQSSHYQEYRDHITEIVSIREVYKLRTIK